jgi:hypothetical protein
MGENLKRYKQISESKNIQVRYIGSTGEKEVLEKQKQTRPNFDYRILPGLFTGLVNTNVWPGVLNLNIYGEPVTSFTLYNKEIASGKAYEGRKDLGNIKVGDGVLFKGRSFIQITGRSNYKLISEALGVDFISNPVLLESDQYAFLGAGWFWNTKKLNKYADVDDFLTITKRINGGTNGLEDRKNWLMKCKAVIK